MRNMSFMLTTQQVLERTKTVTRRLGWADLKPGDRLRAVEKAQGLKKGERIKPLAVIEVVSARWETLDSIDDADVAREGFPHLDAHEFVHMFCKHMRCERDMDVRRIEFKYVELPEHIARRELGEQRTR